MSESRARAGRPGGALSIQVLSLLLALTLGFLPALVFPIRPRSRGPVASRAAGRGFSEGCAGFVRRLAVDSCAGIGGDTTRRIEAIADELVRFALENDGRFPDQLSGLSKTESGGYRFLDFPR